MHVLCDFHHTDLFRSLRTLFEKRFGWRFYRPLGQDWWDRGYFFHGHSVFGRGVLTQGAFHRGHLRDLPKGAPSHYPHGEDAFEWSWITLEEAAQKIDLVLTTLPENVMRFLKFRNERRPGAKMVRYIGNDGESPGSETPNLLCANFAIYKRVKRKFHSVFFHPEFDLSLYRWDEPPRLQKPVIRTFLNYILETAPWSDPNLFFEHRLRLKEHVDFYVHGLGTPPPGVSLGPQVPLWTRIEELYGKDFQMPDLTASDGEPRDHEEISRLMRRCNMAWHVKTKDGYGFILHQLYACGRPVICLRKNYEGKTGGLLLKDRKTCVMVEGSREEDIRKIFRFLEPEENRKMCEQARRIFEKTVDFDSDAQNVRRFLEHLR